jgi:hypothetical protein
MLKKSLISVILFLSALFAFGQSSAITKDANGMVTISSRGNDVRIVVHDLFSQNGRNYILEPGVKFQTLYLSLASVEFDEALFQICRLADLKFDVQNGIFYISKNVKPVEKKPDIKPEVKSDPKAHDPKPTPIEPKPIPKPEATGLLPTTVLSKRVTTRLEKVEIRDLMAEFSKQTGLKLEVNSKVPKYRIDAYLINTSLKYALDLISSAAGLRYRFTDRLTIEVIPLISVANDANASKGPDPKLGH